METQIDNSYLPKQSIPYSKKKASDFKIMKQSAAYYANQANFDDKLDILYRYANGSYVDTRIGGRYKKLLNPLGLNPSDPDHKKILDKGSAATLKNFPIITPIINKFLGELRERSFDYIIKVINPDTVSKRDEALKAKLEEYYKTEAFNMMNQQGINTGIDSVQQPPVEEVVQKFHANYADERAIAGQHALNIIIEECKLYEQRAQIFLHWVVAGYYISYRGIENDTVIREVVAPRDFWYVNSPDIQFIEDTEAQVRRLANIPIQRILDMFPDLSSSDLIKIKNKYHIDTSTGSYVRNDTYNGNNSQAYINNGYLNQGTIKHVVWRSKRQERILYYTDELGAEQYMEVDEDYVMGSNPADIRIDEKYVDEYWECYNILDDIWSDPKPLDVDSTTIAGKAKSCYNGRAFSDMFAENMSIVKWGEDFQQEVNEIRYRTARTMEKNNDNITLIDISVINNGEDGIDDFINYAKEFGFAFINRKQAGADKSFNQYSVLQASQIDAVVKGYELMQMWVQMYHDIIGFTPQRLGEIKSSAGKGITDEAISQSATISEEHFARFEEVEERDMQYLLDCSKFAWRNGRNLDYTRPDGEQIFYQIDEKYPEIQHRIVAKRSAKEKNKVKALKDMLLPIIQNSGQQGVKPEMIAAILDLDNMAEIKKKAKEFSMAEQKAIEAQQEADRQNQQALQDKVNQDKAADRADKIKIEDNRNRTAITTALINQKGQQDETGATADNADAFTQQASDIMKENNKRISDQEKNATANRKIDADREGKMIDAGVKLKDIDAKIKISKNKPKPSSK